MSLSELCVNQTSDLFIIGKNFLKGTKILFQELGADETDIKWQSEADIEVEYFQQVCVSPCAEWHLIGDFSRTEFDISQCQKVSTY